MNWKVSFKALTLGIALSATLYSIYLLNSQHSTDFFNSLGFTSSKTLNWCSDRLQKAEGITTAWTLESKERQWILTIPQQNPMQVDPLDMEKWLARYCTVSIHPVPKEKLLDLKLEPSARLFFNDGQKALLYQKDLHVFQINEVTFESTEFQAALKQLSALLKVQF